MVIRFSDPIDPRLKIGPRSSEIAVLHTGSQFHDLPVDRPVDVSGDAAVKITIRSLQYRLSLPRLAVLLDLDIVLIDRNRRHRSHRGAAPALSRNSPIKVMRSSIKP